MRIISFPSFTMRVLVRQLRYFTQMKRSFNSTKTKVKWQVRNKCNNVMVILYRKISLSLSLFIIIILPCTHFISHPSHFIDIVGLGQSFFTRLTTISMSQPSTNIDRIYSQTKHYSHFRISSIF